MSSILCAEPRPLLVAAASDLQPLSVSLPRESGYPIVFTFGSSGLLARQIAHGAPYDVFLSADQTRVRTLAAKGHLLANSATIYARGRLALWSKDERVDRLEALERVRFVALANPAHAPYGVAAKEALERSGLWSKLGKKIVYAESVRQAFEYASSGNADAALVAWSLVFDRKGRLLPESLHSPILQSGGVLKSSRQPDRAGALMRFLTSPAGQALLGRYGFTPVNPR